MKNNIKTSNRNSNKNSNTKIENYQDYVNSPTDDNNNTSTTDNPEARQEVASEFDTGYAPRSDSIGHQLDGNFYRASRAHSGIQRRPHLRNASAARQRRHGQVKAITVGSGPLAMLMIYLLDFMLDMFIDLGSELLVFFSDGFEYAYQWVMGGFKGIIPDDERQDIKEFREQLQGMCISYKFIRYTITLISPPVGVFLGKGFRGFMTIIVCIILTYAHFVLGIIYALLVTSNCRFADAYEKHEAKRYKIKERELKAKGQHTDLMYIVGFIAVFGIFFTLLYLMMKLI